MLLTADAFFQNGGDTRQPPPTNPLLAVADGVGTIDIIGPIMRNPDVFDRLLMDATDSNEIHDAIEQAASRPDVRAVFLNIDSPGGTVLGTPELAAAVASLNETKPVYAFSSGLMCSAAYWIASQARAIYATPSARVGSIGVVQTVMDQTQRLGMAGIKMEVFAVGKYKAIGHPANPLTDEHRDHIRENLQEVAADFHAAVLSRGRAIPAEALEGQAFSGKQAQKMNLAGMVPNRAEAMRRLQVYHAAVDTRPRAMKTIEDQFAEATTELTKLREDFAAQESLAAEASSNLAAVTAELDTAKAELSAAKTRVAELEDAKEDFDAKVQTEVARIVASTGTTSAATVTGASGNNQVTREEFNAMTPIAAMTFIRNGGTII